MHYLRTYTRVSNHSERKLESRSSTIPPALHVYETPLGTVQRVLQHSPELSELKIIREWLQDLSLIHISEPTRLHKVSRMPSSA